MGSKFADTIRWHIWPGLIWKSSIERDGYDHGFDELARLTEKFNTLNGGDPTKLVHDACGEGITAIDLCMLVHWGSRWGEKLGGEDMLKEGLGQYTHNMAGPVIDAFQENAALARKHCKAIRVDLTKLRADIRYARSMLDPDTERDDMYEALFTLLGRNIKTLRMSFNLFTEMVTLLNVFNMTQEDDGAVFNPLRTDRLRDAVRDYKHAINGAVARFAAS